MKQNKLFSTWDWIEATLLIILILGISSLVARSQTTNVVTVAWDPNPVEDVVTGYVVYYGLTSNTTTNKIPTVETQQAITNLTWNSEHWFYVTATNAVGLESDPSTVLNYTVPEQPTIPGAPKTLRIELKILSANQILGPFTNEVAHIGYRYTLPMELFVADVSSISAAGTNDEALLLLPPTPTGP